MSLANRFLYFAGRELSEDGRVTAFQSPSKNPKVQDTTGPFQVRATKKQTGFTEWGDMTMTLIADEDLEAFLELIHGKTTGLDEPMVVWGDDSDALASGVYFGKLLRISAQPKTEPAALTEFDVIMTPNLDGFLGGKSIRAMAVATGDGDTESTPLNNGVVGSAITIATSSIANPSVITTTTAHGFETGDTVLIAGHTSVTPDINGSHTVTVTGTLTFTIPVNVTADGVDGTATRTSTRDGGEVQIQISAHDLDTADGLSFIVRHSPDSSTWATKGTFTTVTTEVDGADPADGLAVRLALTGVIDRYVAIEWDFTGTAGSAAATFAAFLHRAE